MPIENVRLPLSKEDYEKVKAWTDDKQSYIEVSPHANKPEILLMRNSDMDVPVKIDMELYPKLAETAKKLNLTLDQLVEWAILNRLLYDRRFPAITRIYSGRNTKLREKFTNRESMTNSKIQVAFEEVRRKVVAKIG